MTPTEKLLWKNFRIKEETELFNLIDAKPESFFKNNFFTNKLTYTYMIKGLISSIDSDGESYSDYLSMAREGSILAGPSTSFSVGVIIRAYKANRKKLVNHVRFFVK